MRGWLALLLVAAACGQPQAASTVAAPARSMKLPSASSFPGTTATDAPHPAPGWSPVSDLPVAIAEVTSARDKSASYAAAGAMHVHPYGVGLLTTSYDVPRTMLLEWSLGSARLHGGAADGAVGISLKVGREMTGEMLEGVYLTGPLDGERSVTFGFVFGRPMKWLALRVGETDQRRTITGGHDVRITRPRKKVWRFEVSHVDGSSFHLPMDDGTVVLNLDGASPLWDSIGLRLDGRGPRGSFDATLTLRRP